jgi:hypothetical protein
LDQKFFTALKHPSVIPKPVMAMKGLPGLGRPSPIEVKIVTQWVRMDFVNGLKIPKSQGD